MKTNTAKENARFSVDDDNRLIVRQGKKSRVVNGKFKIDEGNRLTYWLNEPSEWRREFGLPSKKTFYGAWKLTPGHDLKLRLDERDGQRQGDSLVLKGDIISADKDLFVFEIRSRDSRGTSSIRLLSLSGAWQADESNRICFVVSKKPHPDTLTLQGTWQLNKEQQIIYRYEKTELKTKTKKTHSLTFGGFWQINERNRLAYEFRGSARSRFDFSVQLENPSLYPAQGVIKYRIGIGATRQKQFPQKIIRLYGVWKFDRKTGLTYEMDYGKKGRNGITFGIERQLTKNDELAFSLNAQAGKPLGLRVSVSHDLSKAAQASSFLRFKRSGRETAVETGARVPF